jgi:hypothetical protein
MSPPKKTAKKAVGHHHDKHHAANDLRRAFEHLGRVAVLRQTSQSSATEAIADLTALAQRAIKDEHFNDAADLLRASEHLSFAGFGGEASWDVRISAELKTSITDQFDELMRWADEHWGEIESSGILAEIYQSSRDSATRAFKARAYHQALEYARAAEALAHVKQRGAPKLVRGNQDLQLKSA